MGGPMFGSHSHRIGLRAFTCAFLLSRRIMCASFHEESEILLRSLELSQFSWRGSSCGIALQLELLRTGTNNHRGPDSVYGNLTENFRLKIQAINMIKSEQSPEKPVDYHLSALFRIRVFSQYS